jgi:hypothetical protein
MGWCQPPGTHVPKQCIAQNARRGPVERMVKVTNAIKDTVSVGEKDELFDAVQKTGSGGCVSIRKGGEVRTHQWGF